MALPLYALRYINEYVLLRMPANIKPKIAMLSYHDIIARPSDVMQCFGKGYNSDIKYRQDSKEIVAWHKAEKITEVVVDTRWLFEHLGFEIDFFDIVQARDNEIYLDLNFNIPSIHRHKYDFVFENCAAQVFNAGTALANTFFLAKKGGIIMHLSPVNMVNHGFYSFSPTLYKDIYDANESEILFYQMFDGIHEIIYSYNIDKNSMLSRPKNLNIKVMQCCIAQVNKEHNTGFKIPTQSKFVKHPMSKLD